MKSTPIHLLAVLLWCAVCAAGYTYWYAYVASESTRVAELAAAIIAKKETAQRANAVKTALGELGNDEALVENYFVSETNIVPFLEGLQTLGTVLGSKVDVSSVATGKDPTRPVLTVALRAEGDFNQVIRTIGAIEYAPYDINLLNLSLSSSLSDKTTIWSANMTIAVGSITATTTKVGMQTTSATVPIKSP